MVFQWLISIFRHITRFKKKFKPILGFITFFLSDFKFRNKILCSLCILRFVDIGAYVRYRTVKVDLSIQIHDERF